MTAKQPPVVLCGRVERKTVRHGTASEHEALMLHTDEGEALILQRIGGNPFRDPETDRLEGFRVTVEGYRLGRLFRYVSARPVTR